jgi:hypothetical protein
MDGCEDTLFSLLSPGCRREEREDDDHSEGKTPGKHALSCAAPRRSGISHETEWSSTYGRQCAAIPVPFFNALITGTVK